MGSNYVNGKRTVLVQQRVKINTRIIIACAIVVGVVTSLVALQTEVSAQSKTKQSTKSNPANTLKISPVRSDIEIPAGTSKKVSVTVSNLTDAPITVRPVENDFIAGDEKGTPALILDADKYAPTHSLKRFMVPLNDVTIPAKQNKVVDVVIIVPKGAQPGGYFGALRFMPPLSTSGGQVNLDTSVASLILMTVPGPAVEKMNLTNFEVQQDGKTNTRFATPDNLQVLTRFENKGSVQQGPFGKITVLQGDKVVYSVDFNNKQQRDMVLPDSARRWEIPLKNIGTFGNYTVKALFTYGSKNQTIEVSKSFWVIPQALIIAAVVGVVVLILLIAGIWFFLRTYKRRILRDQHRGGRYRR